MTSRFRTIRQSDPRFEQDGLRHVTFKSPALKGRADLTLFLPEAKDLSKAPLVILLHGVHGSHWHWALRGGAHRTAREMIAKGEIRPMVLAMPSDGLWGDGSAYLPHHGADYEQYIIDEVPALVSEVAGCAGPLFLSGLSMGGFGALRLGAKYAARVRGISAHSSVTELSQLAPFIEEPTESYGPATSDEGKVLPWIERNRASLPPLRFDCGTSDSLLGANRALHEALVARGIEHVYQEFDGEHNFAYWEKHLPDTLRFLESIL
jgi:putative tributyrin esterase